MYYHVIVETTERKKNNNYERIYELDNNKIDDITKLIIQPYLNKENIYIDGMYIQADKIRSLKIKSSQKPTKELRDIAQKNVPYNAFIFHTQTSVVNSEKYVTDITKETLRSVGEILNPSINETKSTSKDKNKVFIVHGRDDLAKSETARFVEKLGFEAIILHEQASSGKTIIEKIEEYTNVGFAIVLYTPCDIGGLSGTEITKPRARQNVVFEHGYLIGKLGRQNVCALVKGDIETPNDISGVVYVSHDSEGGWKFKIAKEMRQSGYAIDLNKI